MKRTHVHLSCLVGTALALLIFTSGCADLKPARSESHYYLLTSSHAAKAARAHPASGACLLRIRPVDLAEYLNTQEMAVRTGPNEIKFSLFQQWAEPLDAGIRRVLTENLGAAPAIREILTDESAPSQAAVYTLSIQVLACEGRLDKGNGEAVFEAAWEIIGPDPRDQPVAHGIYRANRLPWNGGDYEDLAAQLSRELDAFGKMLLPSLPH